MTTKTDASPAPANGTRTDLFKEEVRSLKIKDPNAANDTLFMRLGLGVMVIGVALAIIGYFVSHNAANTATGTLNDAQEIGMIGIALTIAGGAVFLRYSLASFLRFWLARMIFEQKHGRD